MSLSGVVFDKYVVSHRLAIGGMAEVYLAFEGPRPVVLKVMLPELARQDGFVQQFLDEARLAARLQHPNVVALSEVGVWSGSYVIAMEFIHGFDLAELRRRGEERRVPIPVEVAARVVADAALGLGHAHQLTDDAGRPLNVVHRDVSPQNVMVGEDGVAKVVDFGIAKASGRGTRTATGLVKGKLSYMAPEQVHGLPLSPRTDQFALGLVLWELLAGQQAYQAKSDVELLKAVLEASVPSLAQARPGLPAGLLAVVSTMLERAPEKRFARCEDAAAALEPWAGGGARARVVSYLQQVGSHELKAKLTPPSTGLGNMVIAVGRAKAPSPSVPTVVAKQAALATPAAAPARPSAPVAPTPSPRPSAPGAGTPPPRPSTPPAPTASRAGTPTGVIYSHTMKMFVDHVLVRLQLLDPAFAKEVTALGLDLARPRDFPYERWITLLRLTAKRLSPDADVDATLDRLGREVFRGFSQSLLGKVQLVALRVLGPRRVMLRVSEQLETADSVTKVKGQELGPAHFVLHFNQTGGVAPYVRGLLIEALETIGAKEPQIAVSATQADGSAQFDVRWRQG